MKLRVTRIVAKVILDNLIPIHRICHAASVAGPRDTRSKHGDSVTSRVTVKAGGGHTTNVMIPFASNASIRMEYHWMPLGFTGSTKR